MKRKSKTLKSMVALVVIGFILLSLVDFSFAETTIKELDLLKQENLRMRNELIELKIKVHGKAEKIPVLMYHHILEEKDIINYGWTGNSSIISVENFKAQMDYLYENNFHTLTLSELEEFITKGRDLPKKTVLITFDDGYLSNTKYAYPIMKNYGFKGTIFMMGRTSEREPVEFSPDKILFLSNNELYKYTDVFEYGSHTYAMHSKVNGKTLLISSPMDKVEEDIKKNRELYKTNAIAYPHGAYNQNVINSLIKNDYKLGFTIKPGYVNRKSKAFELNRFTVYPNTNIKGFQNIVNGQSK